MAVASLYRWGNWDPETSWILWQLTVLRSGRVEGGDSLGLSEWKTEFFPLPLFPLKQSWLRHGIFSALVLDWLTVFLYLRMSNIGLKIPAGLSSQGKFYEILLFFFFFLNREHRVGCLERLWIVPKSQVRETLSPYFIKLCKPLNFCR